MRRPAILATILGLSALLACGGSGTGPSDPPTGTIALTAINTVLVPGLTTQLTWVVKDAEGSIVSDVPVTFTTSPAGIVSIAADGLVLGLAPGSATIAAHAGKAGAQLTIAVGEGGVVGPAGGTIRGLGGKVELEVPAGAAAAPVAIQLSTSGNPLLDPTADPGSTVEINTSSQAFSLPATLRLRFDATKGPYGLPAEEYRIRAWRGSEWVPAEHGASDDSGVASAMITEGGLFSVGWAAPAAPCTGPEYHQFDFWIGAWSITAGGQANGQSDITAAPGGCAILEHYRSLGGDVGRSISFYQPATGLWYQTYIDNRGNRSVLAGFRQGSTMELYSPVVGTTLLRTTFTAQGDGTVRHRTALSTDGGGTYQPPIWDGLYARR